MANLSGQTIQSTYPGLLNLNTATTGITSSPQAITDGLGNNTGIDIATNYLAAPNILNYQSNLQPDYMGVGFSVGGTANQANSQNRLIYGVLYDTGFNSYSAITYNMVSATTTSDVVSFSLYTPQMVTGYGISPKDLIVSGITLTSTGAAGVKTTSISPNLSFSGQGGGGFYIYAFVVSNANVTPTVRYGVRTTTTGAFPVFSDSLGFNISNAGTSLQPAGRSVLTASLGVINTVQSSYTAADIQSQWSSVAASNWGFGLNVVK